MSTENSVREAALKLHDAIASAIAEGYRVDWPSTAAGLPNIAVSETGKVGAAAVVQPGDEYDNMTKSALLELATARGIEVPSSATKVDVIALLKNPPAPAAG